MNENEELIELLKSISLEEFKNLSYDNFNLEDIRKKLIDCKYENKKEIYNSQNRLECWKYLFKKERNRLNPPKPKRVSYSNHCMTCKTELTSDRNDTCPICGYLICSSCGSCFCSGIILLEWNEEMIRFEESIGEEKEELKPLKKIEKIFIRVEYLLKSINIK